MLLICTVQASLNCQKVRSRHGYSARSKDSICPACAQVLRDHPERRSLASILKGSNDAEPPKTGSRDRK